jgi:hypothetical protein
MGALQVESQKCGVSPQFRHRGGIYRVMGELHRLGEIGLAPSGGRSAGRVERPPPTFSTAMAFYSSCRTHVLKAVGQTNINHGRLAKEFSRPVGPFGQGFGPLDPCVKYTPVVMMILIFGQLYSVIP